MNRKQIIKPSMFREKKENNEQEEREKHNTMAGLFTLFRKNILSLVTILILS